MRVWPSHVVRMGRMGVAGNVFTPARLFASGAQGVWYDPSDSTTVFQDAAGTTPAVVGDPVGLILDKSGNGNHASQATATKRFVLRQDAGGHYYFELDGTDDFFQTAAIDFTGTDKATIFNGVMQTVAQAGIIGEISTNSNVNNGAFQTSIDAERLPAVAVRGNATAAGVSGSNIMLSTPYVQTGQIDIAGATRETEVTQRINGAPDNAAYAGTADNDGGNLGNHVLYVGARAGTSVFLAGRIYQMIIVGAAQSAGVVRTVEQYVGEKTGVVLV